MSSTAARLPPLARPAILNQRDSRWGIAVAWFRCFIRGENFPAIADDSDRLAGFFTTRFVEADNDDDAEARGLETLLADPWFASMRGNSAIGRATVSIQEIDEVMADSVPAQPPGFTFFRMDDDSPAG